MIIKLPWWKKSEHEKQARKALADAELALTIARAATARVEGLEDLIQAQFLRDGMESQAILDYMARKVEDRHTLEFVTVPAEPERVEVRRRA